jgi:hypothetical protein
MAGARADLRFGDIPIAGDESLDLASGALVAERPERLCIGSRAFLHGAVSTLLMATSAFRRGSTDDRLHDRPTDFDALSVARQRRARAARPRLSYRS